MLTEGRMEIVLRAFASNYVYMANCKDCVELRSKISKLQKEIKEKDRHIADLKAKVGSSNIFEFSDKGLKLKLYRLLLKKYAPMINERETKTVGEIKGLINKDDLTVQSLAEEFKKDNYQYEKDFLFAAKKAFDFVKREVAFVSPDVDINFWLTPTEILSNKIADDEDMAVFLCSILYALGCENASVTIAELEDLRTHAFVMFDYKNKTYFLDATQNHEFEDFSGDIFNLFQDFSVNGIKIRRLLYKFNRFEYRQFIE
ncbi:MAG: hypothetical protein N3F05_00885 [Candidatus Diapherotrites archaeon]|nr:hypothetical protein [Candidatus Diapherotrites archaeon]